MSYYRAVGNLGRGRIIFEGSDPMIAHMLEPGPLGDHARWWMKRRGEEWLRSWPAWKVWQIGFPPRPYEVRFEEPYTPVEELAGWAITAAAIVGILFRRK